MSLHVLEREQVLRRDLVDVFDFFAQAGNLELLTPPWLRFELLEPRPTALGVGTSIDYRLRLHGLPLRWRSRIDVWEPPRRFVDVQLRGPYRSWHHTHAFEEHRDGTLIRDRVVYELPLGPLGELARALFVRGDLERIFEFRHAAVRGLLASGRTPAGSSGAS